MKSLLKDQDEVKVDSFIAYIQKLKAEKDKKTGGLKNLWLQNVTDGKLAELYRKVVSEGLDFDGVHVTLQSTGINYDYVAYKNKMLLAYPESQVDLALVYKGDEFEVKKESGKVEYTHKITQPFGNSEIVGGYCVIRNKRGEFLTILNASEIEKHRKLAKQDYIWANWFKEMALKTVIKKACKQHFADIFTSIEEVDNENYNLDNPLGLDVKWKSEIDAIETKEELLAYYAKNKGKGKEFDSYIAIKANQYRNANS